MSYDPRTKMNGSKKPGPNAIYLSIFHTYILYSHTQQ